MPRRNRKLLFTFAAAGIAAIVAEHMVKPSLKRKLRI